MPFPSDVAERALIDCGRHCCLCHKFCGFKIELHHIIQKSELGEDSYNNCIPLCFDCHAEVKAYNPKHPKGRQYTVSELRAHRDKWYEKVRVSHATVANPNYTELDRKTFLEVQKILPSTGTIYFLRRQDYAGVFPRNQHVDLTAYAEYCTRPEFEFFDADLEGLKVILAEHINQFRGMLSQYVSVTDSSVELRGIPHDWSYHNPEESSYAVRTLNDLADKICTSYDDLIRLGRRKLTV
ncbi:MAG: HNH endonuclease [Anaerolineales bacterium]